MVRPQARGVAVVKKKTRRFKKHQHDRHLRVKPSWRKPKGIDSNVRRRFKGTVVMPSIGFGSDKRTRNVHPDGFKHKVVMNISDLENMLMVNRDYAAVIHHAVGAKKREAMVNRAKEMDIHVVRPGRLTKPAALSK